MVNAITGLSTPDTFNFGNAIGESGNDPANALVNLADVASARLNQTGFGSADIDNAHDFDRSGRVNLVDVAIARENQSGFSPLRLINLTSSKSFLGGDSDGTTSRLSDLINPSAWFSSNPLNTKFFDSKSFDSSSNKKTSMDKLFRTSDSVVETPELTLVGKEQDLHDRLEKKTRDADRSDEISIKHMNRQLDRFAESFIKLGLF